MAYPRLHTDGGVPETALGDLRREAMRILSQHYPKAVVREEINDITRDPATAAAKLSSLITRLQVAERTQVVIDRLSRT